MRHCRARGQHRMISRDWFFRFLNTCFGGARWMRLFFNRNQTLVFRLNCFFFLFFFF